MFRKVFTGPHPGVESTSGNYVFLPICLSVITSNSFPYSDCKLTQPPTVDLCHATSPTVSNVPIHVSHARQSTGPPMNRIKSQTVLFHLGSS